MSSTSKWLCCISCSKRLSFMSPISVFDFIGLGHAQLGETIEQGTADLYFGLLAFPFTSL